MVKLSKKTINLLKDDIVTVLYENPLKPMFTNEIAVALRRDNEFTKSLLLELREIGIITNIKMNKRKKEYLIRKKWVINHNILKGMKA